MTNTDTHAHEVSSSPVEIEIRGQVAINLVEPTQSAQFHQPWPDHRVA